MSSTLPEIIYEEIDKIPVVNSPNSMYYIPLYKNEEYFASLESYVKFLKDTERLVRSNNRYNRYIKHIRETYGLKNCQVLSNIPITEDNDVDIEMHHGPILTLYDICAIVLEHFIQQGWKISTFRVADQVLIEHEEGRVQTVMLSATVHEEVHERDIFINMKQAVGDINAFVRKYHKVLSDEYIDKINKYIERSLKYDSNDFGVLELNKTLYKFID